MVRSSSFRLATLALLLLVGAIVVYVAGRAGGAQAALPATIAVGCAAGLLLLDGGAGARSWTLTTAFDVIGLALPAALVVFFAFNSGGYFAGPQALAAMALVVILVLRLTLAEGPFNAISVPLAAGIAALGLLVLWILTSSIWSDTAGRALVEFDRAFMYLLVFVAAGFAARTASRLRWLAAGLAAAAVAVAVAALATRLLPDRFPTSIPAIGESNLAWPLTYSNALGIVCVLGAILCLYFASSVNQPRAVRALGAAALPILATTVYLTLSRGPVAAAIVGIVAFALLGRPRGLLTGLLAAVPPSVVAVASAYQHPILTSNKPQAAAAVSQGHAVARVVIACVIAAALLRLLLSSLDDRLRDYRLPSERRRPVVAGAWAGLAIVVLGIALAVNAPAKISDQYDRFVSTGQAPPGQTDLRQSVFSSANRGIVDNWRIALDAFKDAPLHGQGAGSYENYWNEHRPARQSSYNVVDAHSLYVEVLGELGIVGFVLLVALILLVLAALLPIGRGANRPLYAALFAVALAWTAHAGVDWDWEMPAVTVIFIGLGGAALATHQRDLRLTQLPQGARVIAGILVLATAITPALVYISQRQLNEARDAQAAGNCRRAIDRAAASIETLASRAEPYEVLGLCQISAGRPAFAVQAFQRASDRDPDNWRYHYDLATAQGNAGIDPRPALRTAQRLNPHNAELNSLISTIPPGQSAAWDIELIGPGGATGAALP